MYKFHKTESLIYVKFGILQSTQFTFHLRSACLGTEPGTDHQSQRLILCKLLKDSSTFTLIIMERREKILENQQKNLASLFVIMDCVSR